jgi:hypothetical protein
MTVENQYLKKIRSLFRPLNINYGPEMNLDLAEVSLELGRMNTTGPAVSLQAQFVRYAEFIE